MKLPEVGEKCFVKIGPSQVMNGTCLKNEVRWDYGAAKGTVVEGVGKMLGADGHTYWLIAGKENNFGIGHRCYGIV